MFLTGILRDWQIGRVNKSNKTKEQIMATRQEHAIKIAKKNSEDTKKKVLNCITGMFAHEYKNLMALGIFQK